MFFLLNFQKKYFTSFIFLAFKLQSLCSKSVLKVIMQGKLIALCILCVHFETSSLWAEFVNKNRCISVHLVSEEGKSIKFDNFDNSHNSFIDFFM